MVDSAFRTDTTHDAGGKSKPKWPADSVVAAHFSPCTKYRYSLTETWNASLPSVMFLMMNPSVASVVHSDPTLRRTGTFARSWGYGAQIVGNVHAYRATDSSWLSAVDDPFGPENEETLIRLALSADRVVLAYGQPPTAIRWRSEAVVETLARAGARLAYLAKSLDGTPRHPLYLRGDLVPLDFIPDDRRRRDRDV